MAVVAYRFDRENPGCFRKNGRIFRAALFGVSWSAEIGLDSEGGVPIETRRQIEWWHRNDPQ